MNNCRGAKSMIQLSKDILDILNEDLQNTETINHIHEKLLQRFIPPGLKAVQKGLAFNRIVSGKVCEIIQNKPYMKLEVEKAYDGLDEIPDWILSNTVTGRKLIAYNQIDMWSGGHQFNRASKYILDNAIHERLHERNATLVCVVCSFVEVKNTTNKLYSILSNGITKRRLCFINGLPEIIEQFV